MWATRPAPKIQELTRTIENEVEKRPVTRQLMTHSAGVKVKTHICQKRADVGHHHVGSGSVGRNDRCGPLVRRSWNALVLDGCYTMTEIRQQWRQ